MFGGSDNINPAVAIVEKIDFSAAIPKWVKQEDLNQPATQNNAVALPDGNIFVFGGAINRGRVTNPLFMLYDTLTGQRTDLVTTNVPRHDHSTGLLTKNGSVWVMGGNRTDLLPREQVNQAVPVLEDYKPAYLFKGKPPVVVTAPSSIEYKETFSLKLADEHGVALVTDSIGSVAILRTGPVTHNWTWGNSYVQLPFRKKKNGKLIVYAPPLPGLAVPGDYLLFVVSKDGVPSKGKHVRLN